MDAAEIAHRFALGRGATLSDGPVARGKEGAVWRLETADGRWAVKVPLQLCDDDENEVLAATRFQEAARAAGVPTPRVQRTTEGAVFATVGHQQVRVYEWVDLLPPDTSLDPAVVGSVVAGIHRASLATAGTVDPWYAEPIGADRWDELVRLLQAGGAPFAAKFADLRDELVALDAWVEAPEVRTMCHRDLWADNMLPTAAGGVCVIDWDNSGPADPNHELGCVLFEFARADPGRARVLMDSYRSAGGPATVSRRGHFSMLIAQLGHITETAATDWLAPNPRSPERADAEAWVSEVLDDPHTRERLDALRRAVAS